MSCTVSEIQLYLIICKSQILKPRLYLTTYVDGNILGITEGDLVRTENLEWRAIQKMEDFSRYHDSVT